MGIGICMIYYVRVVCCREREMAQFRQQLATLSTSGGSHRDLAEKYRQVFQLFTPISYVLQTVCI